MNKVIGLLFICTMHSLLSFKGDCYAMAVTVQKHGIDYSLVEYPGVNKETLSQRSIDQDYNKIATNIKTEMSVRHFCKLTTNLNMAEGINIDISRKLKFNNLLVLGIGSKLGANYKIEIFRKLRPFARNIYVSDLKDNTLISTLLAEGLIDYFLPVSSLVPKVVCEEVIKHLKQMQILPDVVVTYREEWLQPRTLIATNYNLPHPKLEANYNSQNKYKTRELLEKSGIESCRYVTTKIENLTKIASSFGFPFFIKPTESIRYEWARWISDLKALGYVVTRL
jgi:hypothetical protein